MNNNDEIVNRKEDEISVQLPKNKNLILGILITLLLLLGLPLLAYIVGEKYSFTLTNPFYILILFVIFYYTFTSLIWCFKGSKKILIDNKYLIVYFKMVSINKQYVYRLDKINNITINRGYKYNICQRLRSFWTKDNGGCIHFKYEGKIIKIGNGLTVCQAEKLISELKEKQFLKEENLK